MDEKPIAYSYYDAPCGRLVVGAADGRICFCDWQGHGLTGPIAKRLCNRTAVEVPPDSCTPIRETFAQLKRYFEASLRHFDLPLQLEDSDFRLLVWKALMQIPYGKTRSYSDIAKAIGRPEAVRAVANAIGANPISIIIPCHRVITRSGAIGGYAGGADKKRFLLELEQADSFRVLF